MSWEKIRKRHLLYCVTYRILKIMGAKIKGFKSGAEAVAEELTNMTKLVFSKTLKNVTWKYKVFTGNLIEE